MLEGGQSPEVASLEELDFDIDAEPSPNKQSTSEQTGASDYKQVAKDKNPGLPQAKEKGESTTAEKAQKLRTEAQHLDCLTKFGTGPPVGVPTPAKMMTPVSPVECPIMMVEVTPSESHQNQMRGMKKRHGSLKTGAQVCSSEQSR